MPEFYTFAQKIKKNSRILLFTIFARKLKNPTFYAIFAIKINKMLKFYDICPKNFPEFCPPAVS